jgi:hypothetical protein
METALRQGGDKPRLVRFLGFGAKGAKGDPQPQMFNKRFGAKGAKGGPKPQVFNKGFGAKGAEGGSKPQMFNQGKRSRTHA